jgi:hypothetical protein
MSIEQRNLERETLESSTKGFMLAKTKLLLLNLWIQQCLKKIRIMNVKLMS